MGHKVQLFIKVFKTSHKERKLVPGAWEETNTNYFTSYLARANKLKKDETNHPKLLKLGIDVGCPNANNSIFYKEGVFVYDVYDDLIVYLSESRLLLLQTRQLQTEDIERTGKHFQYYKQKE